MEMRIGIQQAITMSVFEQMLMSVLCGDYTLQYAEELARLSTNGEARAKKIRTVINRLATGNPLMPYMQEHKEEVMMAMQNENDKKMIFVASVCATFPFAYHTLGIIGKYLHVQDEISTGLIKGKLSEVYGSVRTLEIALNAVMPMLTEAGFLYRKKAGIYELGKVSNYSNFAHDLYRKAFLANNATYTEDMIDKSNPFFEFIR